MHSGRLSSNGLEDQSSIPGQVIPKTLKMLFNAYLLMSSSLLLQQCPVCFICLTWMVSEMGGRWLYNFCFVGCQKQHITFFCIPVLAFLHAFC